MSRSLRDVLTETSALNHIGNEANATEAYLKGPCQFDQGNLEAPEIVAKPRELSPKLQRM